jgi:hypothetical protein
MNEKKIAINKLIALYIYKNSTYMHDHIIKDYKII